MEFNATFIVALLSFVIFTVVMNIILYKPLTNIVNKRTKIIDANYSEANKNIEKSKAIVDDRNRQIADANANARNIIETKTLEANQKRDELTNKAKKEAMKHLEDSKLYFDNATRAAKVELVYEVVNLAQNISDKFLKNKDKIVGVDSESIQKIMQG